MKFKPFTGKEDWKVWFTRFDEMTDDFNWSEKEKSRELLNRLEGSAAEFVYKQLNRGARSDYKILSKELCNRFRKIETNRTYAAQFSKRVQIPTETVEEFAAELKRLYDHAHPNRDRQTRREDLLRKFLDCISDDRARFQVEYTKNRRDQVAVVHKK